MTTHIDILILIARPAAGKSEIIDFLKRVPPEERSQRFHLGELTEMDDFPMIWTWFEEDDLLSQMGHPRLHTDEQGYFLAPHLWDLLMERLALDYAKLLRDHPKFHQDGSLLLEFARGSEHGGFRRAFEHLPASLLARAGILYVAVSWEESLRKNRARFNPNRPDSILEHALPDDKLERLYRCSDWDDLASGNPHFLPLQGIQVPYVVFNNEDDVTSRPGPALENHLAASLERLYPLYQARKRISDSNATQ